MKVYITRIIPEAGLQRLREAGHTFTSYEGNTEMSREALLAACSTHDALLSSGPNKLDDAFFSATKNLKAISLLSAGFDNVDVAAANRQRVPVGHTPGVLNAATANTAFLLILAVSRNAFGAYRRILSGDWGFFQPTANLGQEVHGKTLGIFGMGRIGSELARLCSAAFGMKIIYHNRRRNHEAEAALGATYVSFDELLQQSDVLSLHANLSDENKGRFDAAAFSAMKPGAIFINTARGAMHVEPDLIDALNRGTIWGAGLDVTNPEPMRPDNPLLQMDRVCVLPHIGSATLETRDAMALRAVENIIAGLDGRPMPHIINPEVYDRK
jgi:lactate dehydrogenase-like 2-hydroxyacid dehydrogenase